MDYFYEVVRSEALATGARVGHAQMDRTLAFERGISTVSELPEAVCISSRDSIVGATQRAIRTNSKIRASYGHRRICALRNKGKCDQLRLPKAGERSGPEALAAKARRHSREHRAAIGS